MNIHELDSKVSAVYNHIYGLTGDPRTIFDVNTDDKLKEYLTICHPDRFIDDDIMMAKASELSKTISRLHVLSQNVKKVSGYDVIDTIDTGDSAEILFGVKDGVNYIIKRGKVPAVSRYLQAEFNILTDIRKKTLNTVYSGLFREPIQDLSTKNDRLTIYLYNNHIPLKRILELKGWLDGRHIAWLYKRILIGLAITHQCGYIHGAVTPDHILVDDKNHGINLIGQIHSIKASGKLSIVSSAYKDWYPTGLKDMDVTPALDILLSAKTMLSAAEDLPKKLKNYLRGLKLDSELLLRKGDYVNAFDIHDEWVELLKSVYGPPKWVNLELI